jgi:hypothetical protein
MVMVSSCSHYITKHARVSKNAGKRGVRERHCVENNGCVLRFKKGNFLDTCPYSKKRLDR